MAEDIEQWVQRHVALLADFGPAITLDQVGDAIGTQLVSQEQIERLLDALERRGVTVEQPAVALAERLRQVLSCARQLRQAGEAPSPQRVAELSGLSVREVRVALLFADVLRR